MTIPELFLEAVTTATPIFDTDNKLTPEFQQLLKENNITDLEYEYDGNFDFFLDNTFEVVQTEIVEVGDHSVDMAKVVKVNDAYIMFNYDMGGAYNQELSGIYSVQLVYPKQVTQTIYLPKEKV